MAAGGDKGDGQNSSNGQNQHGDAPGNGASQAASRSLQDLMSRLPMARSQDGFNPRAASPVGAPLRTNREYNGVDIAEPDTAATASAATAAGTPIAATTEAPFLLRPSADQPASQPRTGGPSLPGRAARIPKGRLIWFVLSFVAPVLLGGLYIFFVLPDQFVTEFRFSVRVPVGNPGALGQASAGSSVSALFGGNPTPGTDLLDNFTVADYVRSPQAAFDLNGKLNLKAMYNRPSDSFSRLGDTASQEVLGRYWKSMVYADYDVTTGLGVVRVKAYSAQDSLSIANSLLASANTLVNDIGNQSQQDTVRFAKEQVTRGEEQVTQMRRQLNVLSAQKGAASPSLGVLQANADLSTAARTNISQIQSQISVLMSQLHNPQAPQIQVLRQQLAANQSALAGAVDVVNAAATNRFADTSKQLGSSLDVLTSSRAALSYAQVTAAAQRLYLTTYVRPTLPESPTAPDRWMNLLLLVVAAGMVWVVGMLVRNSILEHRL